MNYSSVSLIAFFVTVAVCCIVRPAAAIDPATIAMYTSQFSKQAAARSETLAIMGGDDGVSGGTYRFYDDDTTINITKIGGKGTIGKAKSIGNTGMTWLPVLGGNVGYIDGKNEFRLIPVLADNLEKFSTYAMGIEAGAKINFTNELSTSYMLGLIYSYSSSSFEARTPLGVKLKQLYSKQLFDWDVQALSLAPSIDIQYEKVFDKDWKFTLLSRYAWFNNWDIASSSAYLKGDGSSSSWETRADLDVRLPVKIFDFPLHIGGYVSADVFGGDFRDTVAADVMYTFNGRLVVGDLTGLWKLNWLGIGGAYIEAKSFSGYSFGLDASFRF